MTRCIFRKPKRGLKLSQGLGVITVMLGAALCVELQPQLNQDPSTLKGTPLLGESGTMQEWTSNSWSSSLR
jgi:hypothetical protein